MTFTADEYRRARHLTDDAAVFLQRAIRTTKRGRPSLDMHIFLTGMVLSLDKFGTATVTNIHKTLTEQLPVELLRDLCGIADEEAPPPTLSIHQLYEVTKRISAALDYTPARAPHLSQAAAQARQECLWEFTALMLAATHIDRPEGSADFALDGTAMWAHERAPGPVRSRLRMSTTRS